MSQRIAVIGVGLIGGSVGLAARRRVGAQVVGWDPDAAASSRGVEVGALDDAAASLAEAVAGAEIVLVAAPVAVLPATVVEVLGAAGDATTVTDVGSTKSAVVAAAADPRFIGGHPLAGAEAAGVDAAREELFEDAPWYLTPGPQTEGVRLERIHRLVTGLGGRPVAIDPATHDRLMAGISHLPHVVANVLVAQAAQALGGEAMPATGPSFRDATRVAGANPELWPGIYAANGEALVEQLDGAIARLTEVRDRIAAGDDLTEWQREASDHRRALLEAGLVGDSLREVRVVVPNRPGVIADLALTLGRAGINIHDMSLSPSPDNRTGLVALWVPEERAARANELLLELLAS